ncbi:hypothetical protein BpHYR1_044612 [Brachionus plicatilis]|uniref:Uncharacterized protein n=1 Tax=Brachionus plicatilis TaxID=10195 RepID=A0A3M7PIF6_BRAPC|nr:hypothetical protein BpHYR1_044612 [Brachionus plicatilis]
MLLKHIKINLINKKGEKNIYYSISYHGPTFRFFVLDFGTKRLCLITFLQNNFNFESDLENNWKKE